MIRFRNFLSLVAALLVGAATLGTPSQVQAAFAVRVTTTAGSQTINDGGAGDLDGLVNNSITVNYGDTAYHLVGTISFTNAPGTASKAILDVSYNVNTFGTTGGAASLEASASGFTQPNSNPETLSFLVNGNGSGTGTLSGQGAVVTNGALFSLAGPSVTLPTSGSFDISGAYAGSGSVSYNGATPFTLSEKISFNLGAESNTSGDGQLTITTPAPASLLLVFSALPVWGLAARRRRRRAQA